MIPTSCLAAVLVYTGYKLINPKSIKELSEQGRGELITYLVTVTIIVPVDLLSGIIAAAVRLLHNFSHLEASLSVDENERRAVLTLRGSATFLRLPLLANNLESVPRGFTLHVDFEELLHIDHACLDLLKNWSQQHEKTSDSADWFTLPLGRSGRGVSSRTGLQWPRAM